MALKFNLTTDEYLTLDEALQGEYKEVEGGEGYELDIDGGVPGLKTATDAVNEFRTRNTEQAKELKALKAQLAEAKSKGKKATTLEERVAAIEAEAKAQRKRAEAAETRVRDTEFSRIVRDAAGKAGVAPAAMDDYVNNLRHARGMTLGDDGETVATEDGTTLDDVLKSDRKDRPYFFAESEGGGNVPGAPGSRSAPAKTVDSVFDDLDGVIGDKAALA